MLLPGGGLNCSGHLGASRARSAIQHKRKMGASRSLRIILGLRPDTDLQEYDGSRKHMSSRQGSPEWDRWLIHL